MQYTWQFFRAGGVDQVAIRTGADLAHLRELDQKLWVALACPTRGIEFDARTLDLIDTDSDGRIRPPELIAACEWACAQFQDPDELTRGGDTLDIRTLNPASDSGKALASEGQRILELLGQTDGTTLSLADVSDRAKLIAAMRFNGDGIVTVKTAEDEAVQALIQQIIDTQGAVKDLGGDDGINQEKADKFFTDLHALQTWQAAIANDAALLPFGADTAAAASAMEAVRAKIDDFFARCRLAAYDQRATEEMNPSQERYRDIAALTLSLSNEAIASLPLAPVAASRTLPLLDESVNPAWAAALRALYKACFAGRQAEASEEEDKSNEDENVIDGTLSEAGWSALKTQLAPFQKWLATRPDNSLNSLSIDLIDGIGSAAVFEGDPQTAINALIAEDKGIDPQNTGITDLERLLRYKRDLLRLVHNFVSFKEFYRREGAIFEAGMLYLDSRSCALTVAVADVAKHAVLAGMAKACLAYCECRRNGQKMTIVAAFTAGSTDYLFVGRNGIFYDREGNDWDATIIKMIENPTNVRQAFLSPYKKFIRAIEEQVAKRAASSDTAMQGNLTSLATGVAATGTAGAAASSQKAASKVDVGTVAALGVALGSISAVLVGLFGKFVDLGWWIPVAILGIMAAISGPSMAVAWLKLRERSLGPILDASGWAINGRMKVNVRLGSLLSKTARVPIHAHTLKDPYAEKRRGPLISVIVVLLIVLIAVWRLGWADRLIPGVARYSQVEARLIPARGTATVAPGGAR